MEDKCSKKRDAIKNNKQFIDELTRLDRNCLELLTSFWLFGRDKHGRLWLILKLLLLLDVIDHASNWASRGISH